MVAILETPTIANPLREGMRLERTADPSVIVIFGITGDLAHGKLKEIDEQRGTAGNRVYYLSTPPDFYSHIVANLARAGLSNPRRSYPMTGEILSKGVLAASTDTSWRRIIVEKPFGHDLASAVELNRQLGEAFNEDQIYRIDHYLGKETVQHMLVFRFANGIWEPIWSRRYVDHVQITVAESLGVEDRASYYDTA